VKKLASFMKYMDMLKGISDPSGELVRSHIWEGEGMSKGNLLVTDDREGIRHLLKEVLEVFGYQVYTAATGQEALDMLKSAKIDLVFLDMKMTGMDGLETLKAIKKSVQAPRVIMMTAYQDANIIKEAIRWGANGFIAKPFDLNSLHEVIAKALQSEAVASL
jgi:CheY-like chemotaxis protein